MARCSTISAIPGSRTSRAGANGTCAEEGRGASIGLRQCDPAEAGHRHHRYAPGLHHLAWRAESRADVDALHDLLIERGIPVLDAPARYPEYSGDYYAVFFEDPDGIKLEYVFAPGWI